MSWQNPGPIRFWIYAGLWILLPFAILYAILHALLT